MSQGDFSNKYKEIEIKEFGEELENSINSTHEIRREKEEVNKGGFNIKDYVIMNIPMDLFCYILIITFSISFYGAYTNINEFQDPIIALRPGYTFPTISGLLPSFFYAFLLIAIYLILQKVLIPVADLVMEENYKKECIEKPEMLALYRFKIISNFFKMMFYTFTSVLGFYYLSNEKFFPTSLLGKGSLYYFYEQYPNSFFLHKPAFIDVIYHINFGYVLFDCYYLYTQKMQSDFLLMLLHHIATISMVIISWVSNYTMIGSVIFYLHYVGDMFVYFVRLSLYIKTPDRLKVSLSVILVLVFIYTRIYVFGSLIYMLFSNPFNMSRVEILGLSANFGLLFIHLVWISMIIAKQVKYFIGGEISDIIAQRKKN